MDKNLPRYVIKFEKFLDEKFCNDTIKQFKKITWKDHLFYNNSVGKRTKRSGKQELEITNEEVPNKKIIMNKLHSAIGQYMNNLNFKWFNEWAGYSNLRFNKYTKTKKMARHCDHIHSLFDGTIKGVPILSCLGILNDNYTGGEFIMFDNTEIKLKKGELLIFPSNFLYPHKVEPVIKGTRYSYISWVY